MAALQFPFREDSREGNPASPREGFDCIVKQYDETKLQAMLRDVQARLGTPAEQPDDVCRAQAIAHQLNNNRTALRLRAELDQLMADEPGATPGG